ncbi:Signal recognition particle receptor FtsY [Candidatus Providencia siddallii]|uniref:Signal recognition particle receptor FtsY n=1 Tax=Candidatus Providencia siddallii TaxID=1715285 RepID=A0A0M6W9U7_9GAMM|nr:Signal recognition particle receptor FtsY [Candidatus Providencia siddallii]
MNKLHLLDKHKDVFKKKQKALEKVNFISKLKKSLSKTRQNLSCSLLSLFLEKKINDNLFDKLEEQLLIADFGVNTTHKIIKNLIAQADRNELNDIKILYNKLRSELLNVLIIPYNQSLSETKKPHVILFVGVNGSGKTTTIGKLAHMYHLKKKSVMLAAGDTFRAAAVEQLQIFGDFNKIPVISQHIGADSASVIFDAIQSAKSKNIDVLIADTAGRLQNKMYLMDELKKIIRVIKKYDKEAPHEVLLTLDSSTGQNAVNQVSIFNNAVNLTGIVLTKFDGTAKAGVVFSILEQLHIPICYIGVGEGIDDLCLFEAKEFINALFD